MTKLGNEALSGVGQGTPIGNLFRRFWLPALLSKEIEPDATPVRLRILSEDLLAFRDTKGRAGVIHAYCRHRLAPLYYGRNEDCGLRCVYHGWKFDVNGKCVDIPNVQPPDNFAELKERASIKSYPTHEAGGIVWVYMGPAEHRPPFPAMEWTQLPADRVHVSRWLHRSNWHLAMEGELDTSHISFLHVAHGPEVPANVQWAAADGAPQITLRETDYGFTYGARRNMGNGQYYWRVTQWMLPMWSAIAPGPDEFRGNGRGWVPIDDNHTMAFAYRFYDRPLTPADIAQIDSGAAFPPRSERAAVQLLNGTVIDTYDTVANKKNDYLFDRERQRAENYSGIWGINEQDRALQESMPWADPNRPGVVDTATELLVRSDYPIMSARRILLKLAADLERGIEPAALKKADTFGVRAASVVSPIDNFDELVRVYGHLMIASSSGPSAQTSRVPEPVS